MIIGLSFEEFLVYKPVIEGYLKKFIDFDQISIYVPKGHQIKSDLGTNHSVKLIEDEKKLLFFLTDNKGLDFVLSIDSILSKQAKKILPHLPAILEIIITNIVLKKHSKLDPYTSTLQFKFFLDQVSSYIENLSRHIIIGPKSVMVSDVDSIHGRFCLSGIKIFGLKTVLKEIGFNHWIKISKQISDIIFKTLCEENIYFNQEDVFFALLKDDLSNIDKKLHLVKEQLEQIHPIKNAPYLKLHPVSIYLIYPTHLPGYLLKKQDSELSYELIKVLTQGFDLIKDTTQTINNPVSLPELIKLGAKIKGKKGENLFEINIGEDFGVRGGQYFGVLDKDSGNSLKAELLITSSSRNSSKGEVVFFCNPFKPITLGDPIIPLSNSEIEEKYKKGPNCVNNLHNFITNFYELARGLEKFSIIIVKGDEKERNKIIDLLKQEASQEITIQLFGMNTSILFVANLNINYGSSLFKKFHEIISSSDLSVGITNFPLLDLSKHETIRYSMESLEHASLLDPIKLTLFDSITFNLIGDKYFIKGDIFTAITQYNRSLALDPKNHIARNSLGICYARIGDLTRAWREFMEAYEETGSITYLYNLGTSYFKLGNFKKAKECFLKCIPHQSYHVYSILRLAQLCERQGELDEALEYLSRIHPESYPLVYKYKAKILIKKNMINKAKQNLENAIRNNPMDAEAIFLLGKIYIEYVEDKKTGKSLINKSICLNPNKTEYKTYLSGIENSI